VQSRHRSALEYLERDLPTTILPGLAGLLLLFGADVGMGSDKLRDRQAVVWALWRFIRSSLVRSCSHWRACFFAVQLPPVKAFLGCRSSCWSNFAAAHRG